MPGGGLQRWVRYPLDLLLAALIGAWLARSAMDDSTVVGVLLFALTPWWGAAAWPLLVIGAARGARPQTALAAACCVAHIVLLSPPTTARPPTTAALRLTSANLYVGNRTPDATIDAIAATRADVLALLELDDEWWARIEGDPRLSAWPSRHVAVLPSAYGIGLLSRLPLLEARTEQVGGVPQLIAKVATGAGPVDLLVVHTTPPYRDDWIDAWIRHLRWVASAGDPARRIAAGDLNASVFHPRFDLLRQAGWRDAAELSGTRLHMTWPATFPVLGLDHVLVDGPIEILDATVLPLPGSDHRMLTVTLRL